MGPAVAVRTRRRFLAQAMAALASILMPLMALVVVAVVQMHTRHRQKPPGAVEITAVVAAVLLWTQTALPQGSLVPARMASSSSSTGPYLASTPRRTAERSAR
jgi:hypothetical protein